MLFVADRQQQKQSHLVFPERTKHLYSIRLFSEFQYHATNRAVVAPPMNTLFGSREYEKIFH